MQDVRRAWRGRSRLPRAGTPPRYGCLLADAGSPFTCDPLGDARHAASFSCGGGDFGKRVLYWTEFQIWHNPR